MRLIDADFLKHDISTEWLTPQTKQAFYKIIDNAPTVKERSYEQGVIDGRDTEFDSGFEQGYAKGYENCEHDNERPQGEWIRKGDSKWHCSKCGAVPEFDGTTNTDKFNVTMSNKYCRLCGADMRKGGAE